MISNEEIVREIINRYGEVINLRETPYLIIEIFRDFKERFSDDGGLPPGGTPPPPGPSSVGIRFQDIIKQINVLVKGIDKLDKKLDRVLAVKAARKVSTVRKKIAVKKAVKMKRKKK